MSAATNLSPNSHEMRKHLEMLFARAPSGRFEICGIHTAGREGGHFPQAQTFPVDDIDEAIDWAMSRNAQPGWNVYVGAAVRADDTPPFGRCKDEDVTALYALFADADTASQVSDAKKNFAEFGIRPPFVVITGREPETRAQMWWPLEDPITDREAMRAALSCLAAALGTDPAPTAPSQLMRLAGTIGWPKDKPGRVLEMTKVNRPPGAQQVFYLDQIARVFAQAPPSATVESVTCSAVKELTGPLGLPRDMIEDGRKLWTFKCVRANLRTFIGETGAAPTVDELYNRTLPVFSRRVSQKRPGCGTPYLMGKCREAVVTFHRGIIPGMRTLEEAVATYSAKAARTAQEAAGDLTDPLEWGPDLIDPATVLDPWTEFVAPPFPVHTLPPVLQAFVDMQATSTGGDISAVAMAVLTACSAALDQRFQLKMKRTGDWYVRPRLWTLLVGDPSSKKTPVINAATKPLRRLEHTARGAYEVVHARWEAAKRAKDETLGDEPAKPVRFVLNDITVEKLGDILSRQHRGALMVADELSGFIGSLERYSGARGGGADRAFWLQAYNGGGYTVDRLNRGEIHITNLAVAFIGGIQPNRLAEMATLTADGLLQRFLPVMLRPSNFPQEVADDEPASRYADLIQYLTTMMPATLTADSAALEIFEDFQRYVFDLEKMDGLGEHFRSFAGKLTGVQGTLALVLHIVNDPANAVLEPVSADAAAAAAEILRSFVIPQATCFYQSTGDQGDWSAIKSIASFILTSTKDRFTVSDLTSGVRGLRGLDVRAVGQKISPLVAGGWIQEDASRVPVNAWTITPGLREHFAERREEELRRKSEAQALLIASCQGRGHAAA